MTLTYFKAIKRAKRQIINQGLDPYVAVYLMQRRLMWSNTRLLMNYSKSMPEKRLHRYRADLRKYLAGESPQYIIGTAPFYGYNFKVNHHVLIPRPETEGLVDWVLNDHRISDSLTVVDIGTGSGAIAIALKLQRPVWRITATDISLPALSVAEENARLHRVRIDFQHLDLFTGLPLHAFDVIISNPPYVSRTEVPEMGPDVLRNEPHEALFAGHYGMAMYERISKTFGQYLKPSGKMYLEIGFHEESRIVRLFHKNAPAYDLNVKRDLANHPRMVKIWRKADIARN